MAAAKASRRVLAVRRGGAVRARNARVPNPRPGKQTQLSKRLPRKSATTPRASSGHRAVRSIVVGGKCFAVALDREVSARLGRVRRAKTKPEEATAKALRALGVTFRRSNRDLPGSPDFANRAQGWTLFVHGCYWHHHFRCPRASIPKTNGSFWKAKFADNRRRDARAARALRAAGFRVVTLWECQTKDPQGLRRILSRLQRADS